MPDITVSSSVDSMMQASDAPGIRDAIGAIAYPYTTDFQAGVEQTRDLSTITPTTAGYNDNIDLTSVYVGSNVTTIGNYAFSNFNSNLAFVSLPETITSIGANAFDGVSSLENLRIPSSVTSFGAACFRDSGLVDITFPAGIQVLEWYGMNGCASLQSATISDGIEIIRNGFFSECTSLQSIEIPNSVYRIDAGAFRDCTSLQSVTLPTNSSYTTVGNYCFGNCSSLLSIDIPASVTLLDNSCFAHCTSLSTINCYATSAPSTVIDTFHNVAATEIHVPVGATGYGDVYEFLTVIYDL